MFEIACMSFATMVGIGLGIIVIVGIITLIEEILDRCNFGGGVVGDK